MSEHNSDPRFRDMLRFLVKLSTIKDEYISLKKSVQASVYGVFVHLPRQERVLGFMKELGGS
jgi:hypothetical protein